MRKEFEAKFSDLILELDVDGESYYFHDVNMAWQGFQAGYEARPSDNMNIQVEEELRDINCGATRLNFEKIDSAISTLYCNGYMPQSQRNKCRNKLIKEIIKAKQALSAKGVVNGTRN